MSQFGTDACGHAHRMGFLMAVRVNVADATSLQIHEHVDSTSNAMVLSNLPYNHRSKHTRALPYTLNKAVSRWRSERNVDCAFVMDEESVNVWHAAASSLGMKWSTVMR